MTELGQQTATALAKAIRAKEVSSRELLDHFLARIEKVNPAINAVVTLDAERAARAAAAADEEAARGDWRGALHGLPVTIKDAIETAGIRSTGGAVELRDHVPAADAPAVARLKDAGAIVFGKTNLPRWSGDLQSYNDLFGTTNNPWDVTRTPGGSSGGAAAAVACGLTSFELGTDIGGSVRIPSHFTGVCGHKPSFGVVSQRGYLDHVGGGTTDADINVFGPLARSVDDLELLLGVLAGPDVDRAKAWRVDLPPSRHTSLADFRVGAWFDDPAAEVDGEVREVLEGAVESLRAAGAKVDESRPAVALTDAVSLFNALIAAAISPSLGRPLAEAICGNHLEWLERDEARARMRAAWADWFVDHDVLLCPVTPTTALVHDHTGELFERTIVVNGKQRPYLDNVSWTGLVGVVYLPSTVVPVGRTRQGLPVGAQVVAPFLEDRTGLGFARHLADITGGCQPPPEPA